MSTVTLPQELQSFGFVVARIIKPVADSPDDLDNFPEAVGVRAAIKFTPIDGKRKVLDETGVTASVQWDPMEFNTNTDGYLTSSDGTLGVWLITGFWRTEISGQTFDIEVKETHTAQAPLDLFSVSPAVLPGNVTLQAIAVPPGGEVGQVLVRSADGGLEWADGGSGGVGVSDHGALTGLADDDHQQYALADGTRGDFASTNHGHVLADISDYTAPDLSGLVQTTDPRLSDARTPTAHDHDDRYYTEAEVDTALADKSDTGHTHGQYVENTDARLSDARTPTSHTHDDRYYTETETDNLLAGKASSTHNHDGTYASASHDHDAAYAPVSHNHDSDYATAAQGATADAAIPSGLVDAKGDLIVGTADNTVARLAGGTDGHVLTRDSAQATGVKWAAAEGGGAAPVMGAGAITGAILLQGGFPLTGTSSPELNGHTCVTPYPIERAVTIDALCVRTLSAVAGASVVIALYDSAADGLPGTRLAITATIPAAAMGLSTGLLGTSLSLSPGLYWIAVYGTGGWFGVGTSFQTGQAWPVVSFYKTGDPLQYNLWSSGYAHAGAPENPYKRPMSNSSRSTAVGWVRAVV